MIHPTKIEKYNGTLQELAEDIGNLRYDAMFELFSSLKEKIYKDYLKDHGRGRKRLSNGLIHLYHNINGVLICCEEIWNICKNYIDSEKEN